MTARENAIGLYMDGIRDGHPREAVAKYTGARYTQHSTGVADGQEGFVAFFEPFINHNKDRDIDIIRALQDGQHVFIHAHQSLNGGDARWITTDFFDSDADGKIIEHWDVIAAVPDLPNASGRSVIDGATQITDLEKTVDNKALVSGFVQTCLIERNLGRIGDFVSAGTFKQHSPGLGDGSEALATFLGQDVCPLSYQECFLMVGEGNFVATLNRARWMDQDVCHVDLYRVEDGKIVEHWDNSEPVPPENEWANSGKF